MSEQESVFEIAFRAAKELGLPALMLAVVVYLFREAALTVHQTVLVPVVSSHTRFLETTQETLKEISVTQDRQAETLHELAESQREIRHVITSRTSAQPNGG